MSIICIVPRDPTSKWDKYRERVKLSCDDRRSQVCLGTWTTHDIKGSQEKQEHTCHNCVRKRYAKQAGIKGGQAAVESGQIHEFIAAAATPESRKKARDSAFKRGKRAFTSKPEELLYEKCVEWFGIKVKRWQNIIREDGKCCNIDIYIPSLDTYVEMDGIYWHGLDRPYEELNESIRAKFDHDRLLDEHCVKHNIRLVRIKDQPDISENRWDEIRNCIQAHTMGDK